MSTVTKGDDKNLSDSDNKIPPKEEKSADSTKKGSFSGNRMKRLKTRSRDRAKHLTFTSTVEISSSPMHSDTLSARMRNYFSLETVLNLADPWSWGMLRLCVLQTIVSVAIQFSMDAVRFSFLKGNPFIYSNCTSHQLTLYNVKNNDLPYFVTDFVISRNRVQPLSTENAMGIIAHILLIVVFIAGLPKAITPKVFSIIGSVIACLGMCLLSTNIYVWKVFGMLFAHMSTKVVFFMISITAIENSPKHIREFCMYAGVVGGRIGESLFLICALHVPFLGRSITFIGGLMWIGVAVAVFILARPSVPYLLHNRKVARLDKALREMHNDKSIHVDVDKVVDDILYIGRSQEPETPLETVWWTLKHHAARHHILFNVLLILIASFVVAPPTHPVKVAAVATKFLVDITVVTWQIIGLFFTLLIILRTSRLYAIDCCLTTLVVVHVFLIFVPRSVMDNCSYYGPYSVATNLQWLVHLSGIAWETSMQVLYIHGFLNVVELVPHLGRPLFLAIQKLLFMVLIQGTKKFDGYLEDLLTHQSHMKILAILFFLALLLWSSFLRRGSEVFVTYNDLLIHFGEPAIEVTGEEEEEKSII